MGGCASKPKDFDSQLLAPVPVDQPEKAEELTLAPQENSSINEGDEVKKEEDEPVVDVSKAVKEVEAPKAEEATTSTESSQQVVVDSPKQIEEEEEEVVKEEIAAKEVSKESQN